MEQIVNGIYLSCPGPAGSPPVLLLVDSGAPQNSSDPSVQSCSVGSLYSDFTGGHLWFKGSSGKWTQAV